MLPVCDGVTGCNGKLERRFESPTTTARIRALFAAEGDIVLEDSEADAVGLWIVKTWLLLAHPQVEYRNEFIDGHAPRWGQPLPERFYDWLITRDDLPPPGLSLWLYRTQDVGDGDKIGPIVPLPEVEADGQITRFEMLQVSKHGLTVELVFHPGWQIEHPYETLGRAVRLWPRTRGRVDLGCLAPLSSGEEVRWWGCTARLEDGTLGNSTLPPLSRVDDLIAFASGPLGRLLHFRGLNVFDLRVADIDPVRQ